MNELAQILRQLQAERFYGSVELKFESAQLVLLEKTETFKPTQQSYGDNRGTHEHTGHRD